MSKRISLWDNARFLLILAVVAGHFAEAYESPAFRSIFLFLYSFHMPGFFLIAGLFHKNTRIKEKALSFFALYFVMKTLFFVLLLILGREPSFKLLEENGLPWFMWAMGCFVLFAYLLRNVDKRVSIVLSILLACFVGYDKSVGDAFVLSRVIVFFPFYLIGTALPRERIEDLNRKGPALRLAALAILAAWGIACLLLDRLYLLRPLFTGRNPFSDSYYPWGPLLRLLCYALSLLLCFCLFVAAPGKACFFTRFGSKTLQVYFWHRVLLYLLTHFGVHKLLCATLPGKAVWLLAAVGITLLLSALPLRFPMDTVRNLILRPAASAPADSGSK